MTLNSSSTKSGKHRKRIDLHFSKRDLVVVIGSIGIFDPIGDGRIDVVRGVAVVDGRTILAIFDYFVDAAEKGTPSGGFFMLHNGVLLLEVNVAYNVDRLITGNTIGVSCWERDGIAVQIVEHISDHEAAAELVKTQNRFAGVTVKGMFVVSASVDIAVAVFFHNVPCLACFGGAKDVGHG